jgi:hypothetical protein
MSPEVTVELVKLIPSVLWVILVAILIAVFYRPIRRELLPKMQGIHVFGMSQTKYDAVISDMNRNGVADEGLKFLTEMRVRNIKLYHWTIFYAAGFDPSKGAPPRAFGMTNRPDYLLHLVLDILERKCI